MAEAGALVGFGRETVGGEGGVGMGHGGEGDDFVRIAVDEADGEFGGGLFGQHFAAQQRTGDTDDAGEGFRPARGDIKRHHGTLGEADERDILGT